MAPKKISKPKSIKIDSTKQQHELAISCSTTLQMAKDYKIKMGNNGENDLSQETAYFKIDKNELQKIINSTDSTYVIGVFGATEENTPGYKHNCLILFPTQSNGNRKYDYSAGTIQSATHEVFPKVKNLDEMNDTLYAEIFNCNGEGN